MVDIILSFFKDLFTAAQKQEDDFRDGIEGMKTDLIKTYET